MKKFVGIVAVSNNFVIGYETGELPWNLASDLKHFAKTTTGHAVIVGNNTWQNIIENADNINGVYKRLPNRKIYVLSSKADNKTYEAEIDGKIYSQTYLNFENLKNFIETESDETVYVIGGAKIYSLLADFTGEFVVTYVDTVIDENKKPVVKFDKSILKKFNNIEQLYSCSDDEYPYSVVKLKVAKTA